MSNFQFDTREEWEEHVEEMTNDPAYKRKIAQATSLEAIRSVQREFGTNEPRFEEEAAPSPDMSERADAFIRSSRGHHDLQVRLAALNRGDAGALDPAEVEAARNDYSQRGA